MAAGVMALGLIMTGPLLALASVPVGKDGIVLVVSPPWRDVDRVIDAAGGRRIGPVTARFGGLATGEGAEFVARLRQVGAWAVLDGTAIATLCGWET